MVWRREGFISSATLMLTVIVSEAAVKLYDGFPFSRTNTSSEDSCNSLLPVPVLYVCCLHFNVRYRSSHEDRFCSTVFVVHALTMRSCCLRKYLNTSDTVQGHHGVY